MKKKNHLNLWPELYLSPWQNFCQIKPFIEHLAFFTCNSSSLFHQSSVKGEMNSVQFLELRPPPPKMITDLENIRKPKEKYRWYFCGSPKCLKSPSSQSQTQTKINKASDATAYIRAARSNFHFYLQNWILIRLCGARDLHPIKFHCSEVGARGGWSFQGICWHYLLPAFPTTRYSCSGCRTFPETFPERREHGTDRADEQGLRGCGMSCQGKGGDGRISGGEKSGPRRGQVGTPWQGLCSV